MNEPMVKLQVSVPESLRDRIDELGQEQRRDRWNMAYILLEKGLAAWTADPNPTPYIAPARTAPDPGDAL
jgi:hypothetical protein